MCRGAVAWGNMTCQVDILGIGCTHADVMATSPLTDPTFPVARCHDLRRSSCPRSELVGDWRSLLHRADAVSNAPAGEPISSRRSYRVSDPPSGNGVGVGRVGSTSQPTPTPPDVAAEDGSPSPRGIAANVVVPRLLVDLYEAVRDLGSTGAAKNAHAALMDQQRGIEELNHVGRLAERAIGRAAASRSDALGPPR